MNVMPDLMPLSDSSQLTGLSQSILSLHKRIAQQAAEIGRHIGQLAVQVARRSSPLDDAALVLGMRRALGPAAILRADANRRWSLQQAVAFGTAAAAANLQVSFKPAILSW